MQTYLVEVTALQPVYTTVVVEADDARSACEKAIELVEANDVPSNAWEANGFTEQSHAFIGDTHVERDEEGNFECY